MLTLAEHLPPCKVGHLYAFYNVSLRLQWKGCLCLPLNNLRFLQMGIFQTANYGGLLIHFRVRVSIVGTRRVEEVNLMVSRATWPASWRTRTLGIKQQFLQDLAIPKASPESYPFLYVLILLTDGFYTFSHHLHY